jgi:hypothetical protein
MHGLTWGIVIGGETTGHVVGPRMQRVSAR